jgi:hypothetical protein
LSEQIKHPSFSTILLFGDFNKNEIKKFLNAYEKAFCHINDFPLPKRESQNKFKRTRRIKP